VPAAAASANRQAAAMTHENRQPTRSERAIMAHHRPGAYRWRNRDMSSLSRDSAAAGVRLEPGGVAADHAPSVRRLFRRSHLRRTLDGIMG
jgi:hypothetical protein